jgi:hypothetical protein
MRCESSLLMPAPSWHHLFSAIAPRKIREELPASAPVVRRLAGTAVTDEACHFAWIRAPRWRCQH